MTIEQRAGHDERKKAARHEAKRLRCEAAT
jgi:hypothetical protein